MLVSKTIEVDAEFDIDIDDIVEFICFADQDELNQMKKEILFHLDKTPGNNDNIVLSRDNPTLADQMKVEFLNDIFDKFTLEELENKLKL